jgi:hypothetical protein
MKKSLLLLACTACAVLFWACERPKSPDFKVNRNVEVPLTIDKSYPFLGDSDALIDSTSDDYADLLSSDGDGLVQLTKEQDFDLGDLSDAVPQVDVPTTSVSSNIGLIGFSGFSPGTGNVDSVGFNQFTGGSGQTPDKGDQIFAGSTPPGGVTIDLNDNLDLFSSAVLANDGTLEVTLTNDLGLHIDQMGVTLNSGSDAIDTQTIGTANNQQDSFNDGSTTTLSYNLDAASPGTDPLENINIEINASWQMQNMNRDAGYLVINDVTGQNITASQITANIPSQKFSANGTATVDNSNFKFQGANPVVALSDSSATDINKLNIDITNDVDIGIDTLLIRFPEIRDGNGQAFEKQLIDKIPANGTYSESFDISGHRITSGTINYTIDIVTEDTQNESGGSQPTINQSDELSASIGLDGLEIGRVRGYINPRKVLLNEDATNDGTRNLDVFNDREAEITNVDGISDISSRVSNITFEDPSFRTEYLTNIGVNTTVYAAIVGTDTDENKVYLTGNSGGKYDVSSGNIPSGLEANGQPLTADQLIKFSLETAGNPDPAQGEGGENLFDASNTNASEFFSNLPTSIRFTGIARVNESQTTGEVVNPVIFDPTLNFDLPFNFSANNATFEDTLDADLGNLPDESDDQQISAATLTLDYVNGLPLDLDASVILYDQAGIEVTSKTNIQFGAANIDGDGEVPSGGANDDQLQISFSEKELKKLHRVRNIVLDMNINTPQQQSVKINADDSVSLQIKLEATIASTVN